MSRIAKKPIIVLDDIIIKIKTKYIYCIKGNLIIKNKIPNCINIIFNEEKKLIYLKLKKYSNKKNILGTLRSIINNNIIGLYKNFEKKLILIGIGYKAFIKDNILNLNIGFSHIITYLIPDNINITCPTSNEIVVRGYDKQLVGQVSARIRSFRPPESYRKGKGIRYINEFVRIKEYKKKTK